MPEQKETFLYPQVRQLFDYESWTYSYLVFDPQSLDAVSIDPVLELHPRDLKLIRELGLKLIYVLESMSIPITNQERRNWLKPLKRKPPSEGGPALQQLRFFWKTDRN